MVVPFWTPITPLTGSLLHADPHPRSKGGDPFRPIRVMVERQKSIQNRSLARSRIVPKSGTAASDETPVQSCRADFGIALGGLGRPHMGGKLNVRVSFQTLSGIARRRWRQKRLQVLSSLLGKGVGSRSTVTWSLGGHKSDHGTKHRLRNAHGTTSRTENCWIYREQYRPQRAGLRSSGLD
jgi:hypothetical protein